ncbi:hypothetical protein ACQ3JU_1275 (plasmid) [Bradyrhizobium guangxiense]
MTQHVKTEVAAGIMTIVADSVASSRDSDASSASDIP